MKSDKVSIKMCRKAELVSIFAFVFMYALYCFVIPEIYRRAVSDITLSRSALPILVHYMGVFAEILAISICYSAMIFSIYVSGSRRTLPFFLIFGTATLLKYLVKTVYLWFVDGGISQMIAWEIADALFFTALELLQFFIVYALINGQAEKYRTAKRVSEVLTEPYPFKRLYNGSNHILCSAAICGAVMTAAKLFGAIASDVWTMIVSGLPTMWSTVAIMLLTYASYVIFGILCYLVIYLTLGIFFRKIKGPQ